MSEVQSVPQNGSRSSFAARCVDMTWLTVACHNVSGAESVASGHYLHFVIQKSLNRCPGIVLREGASNLISSQFQYHIELSWPNPSQ
jgi:hypothetical protein